MCKCKTAELKDDAVVTVCSSCQCASCWQGQFNCWQRYKSAGSMNMTVAELRGLALESPHWWHIDPSTGELR